MSRKLVSGQLAYTTADVEEGQFAGEFEPIRAMSYLQESLQPIPAGEYRVIDGELFQVIHALPDHGAGPRPEVPHTRE